MFILQEDQTGLGDMTEEFCVQQRAPLDEKRKQHPEPQHDQPADHTLKQLVEAD